MKRVVLLLVISVSSLFSFDYSLKPTKINDTVWCFLGHLDAPSSSNGGFLSNSCYIKTKTSYVIVDAGGTYEFAKQAYESMSKIAKLPVSFAINTHYHDDHWMGSSFYKEKFNTTLIGSSLINENYELGDKTRLMKMLPEDITKGTKIIKMDVTVEEEKELVVAETTIRIFPMGVKAHTAKDLFVYLPKSKTLFSGDTVMNGRVTSNRDGSVIGQIQAHEKMNALEWNNLVPGHGHDTSKTAMNESKLYFKLLKERIQEAIEEDIGASTATKTVRLEEFKDKALYNELNKRNVFDAYNELEFYEEE